MKISIPITVLTILAVAVAGTAWLSPPVRDKAEVSIKLPAATYNKLALRMKGRTCADGRPLTVVQVIEDLVTDRQ